jgi:hypothetical protein
MSATGALITDLRKKGVRLYREGTRLMVEAPRGVITPEIHAELLCSKQELLTALGKNHREPRAKIRSKQSRCARSPTCWLQLIGVNKRFAEFQKMTPVANVAPNLLYRPNRAFMVSSHERQAPCRNPYRTNRS